MPKNAKDAYIDYRIKLCKPQIIRAVKELSEHWGMTDMQVCTRVICEGIVKELSKKREIENLKK